MVASDFVAFITGSSAVLANEPCRLIPPSPCYVASQVALIIGKALQKVRFPKSLHVLPPPRSSTHFGPTTYRKNVRKTVLCTFWIYTPNVNSHHFLQHGQLNGQSQESGSVTLKSRLFRPWSKVSANATEEASWDSR